MKSGPTQNSSPGGATDISPALQRWEKETNKTSPEGTTDVWLPHTAFEERERVGLAEIKQLGARYSVLRRSRTEAEA